ncbi:hypothetical protein [Weissella cibaria]|nr:hypothetical protein [Weissella cibaria]
MQQLRLLQKVPLNSGRVALWLHVPVVDVDQMIDAYSLPIKKTAAMTHF